MKVRKFKSFKEIYNLYYPDGNKRIATKNLTPGNAVYGEDLEEIKGTEYRLWDPTRSKLAAAIIKGLKSVPIKPKTTVLYLGAASGTTPSHISDIIGPEGFVYCVEFSPRSIRDLVFVCERRKNMLPLLDDARNPRSYHAFLQPVDVVYCDIAQPDQAEIIVENAKIYLKPGDHLMLAIKARSINPTKNPSIIYKQQMNILEQHDYEILEAIDLHPLEKDHAMILAKY
ncbi:MAG: fibrillarin-like rRNA/tRNA 2'-O-methyltransferase [Asgard group archaeon]|nr:fibrillarin-like rRNA/tRNA 2'-O-methyltransferase [Asgard group archaeon]